MMLMMMQMKVNGEDKPTQRAIEATKVCIACIEFLGHIASTPCVDVPLSYTRCTYIYSMSMYVLCTRLSCA